ncbi:MAG TPA: hypothetical protein VG713_12305 [Pirellulales bacterium]|nr:hypothetical protein [Pirellulales bacterium]
MRPVALVLIVLGVLTLSVHSITYFQHQTEVGPLGFFAWDVEKPYTILISPVVGTAGIGAGIALLVIPHRARSA